MKKFSFSLEKMLHYKDSLLEREKGKLSEIRARKNLVDDKIQNSISQMLELDDQKKARAQVGIGVSELRMFGFHIENTRLLVDQLKEEQANLEIEVEKQLKVVVLMSQEVSGLDKLRDKQLTEYNHVVQKEEELNIGELVASKYIRQNAAQSA